MPDTNVTTVKTKDSNEWSESFKRTPRTVKIKGDWVVLGRSKMKLANGVEVLGPESKEEWDLAKKLFPQAFAISATTSKKRFGL